VARIRSAARSHWLDVVIVAAAIDAALEVALRHDADAARTTAWVTAPAAAALVLCLLARRRLAFAAPAGLWLFAAALSFIDGRLVVFTVSEAVAGMAAAFLLGNLRDDIQARLGLAIVLGGAAIIVSHDPGRSSADYLAIPAQFAIAWIVGYALRERAARAEAAEAAARVAVAEERARIARELHDVVAHAISVMVLQVGAVRHHLGDDAVEDAEALKRVEQAGRTALTEMRGLLGAMRREGEAAELGPQPGLADLDGLLNGIRRAGLPVDLKIEGAPAALPAAIELSAYRIIQEGLTNTLKHAGASHADVLIRYGEHDLEIEVRDDGHAGAGAGVRAGSNGKGHGLVGVRERVKIYGGEMSASSDAGGGFTLRTSLPLTGYAP
jgi:signal transduction histidine kinase